MAGRGGAGNILVVSLALGACTKAETSSTPRHVIDGVACTALDDGSFKCRGDAGQNCPSSVDPNTLCADTSTIRGEQIVTRTTYPDCARTEYATLKAVPIGSINNTPLVAGDILSSTVLNGSDVVGCAFRVSYEPARWYGDAPVPSACNTASAERCLFCDASQVDRSAFAAPLPEPCKDPGDARAGVITACGAAPFDVAAWCAEAEQNTELAERISHGGCNDKDFVRSSFSYVSGITERDGKIVGCGSGGDFGGISFSDGIRTQCAYDDVVEVCTPCDPTKVDPLFRMPDEIPPPCMDNNGAAGAGGAAN